MKQFGMCIDKRVVGAVAIGLALLWWLAPGAFAAALPLLLLAICPLSMVVMMRAMDRGGDSGAATSSTSETPAAGPAPSGLDLATVKADLDARRN